MNFPFRILLSLLIIMPLGGTVTNFSHASISLQPLLTTNLNTNLSQDTCSMIHVTSSQIYHLNSEYRYQSWLKAPLGDQTEDRPINLSSVSHFSVSSKDDKVGFIKDDNVSGVVIWTLYLNESFDTSFSTPRQVPAQFILEKGSVYTVEVNATAPGVSTLYHLKWQDLSQKYKVSTSHLFNNLVISPDSTCIITWTDFTAIQVYKANNMRLQGSYSIPATPLVPKTTNTITFSYDSSLAIIETDYYNPIIVLDVSSLTIFKEISINDSIRLAFFLNSSNDYIVVIGSASTYLVDLVNNVQYAISPIVAAAYDSFLDNTVVTCYNNVIQQNQIVYTVGTFTPTPTSNPTTVTIDQTEFYTPLILDQSEAKTYQVINNSLSITSEATTVVSTAISAVPITVFFLSFLNYFTLSSLYVLLNFPIPEHVYMYLSMIYDQINTNVLAMMGIDVEVSPLSSEKVNRKRALFFGVSSDLLPPNISPLVLLLLNLIAIVLLHVLSTYLRRSNFLRKLIRDEKWNLFYGQITNVITIFTLPWSFLMLEGGVCDFGTKVNFGVFSLLYFVALFFPIYYFFELIKQRSAELSPKKRAKTPTNQFTQVKSNFYKNRKSQTCRQLKSKRIPHTHFIETPVSAEADSKPEKKNSQPNREMRYKYQVVWLYPENLSKEEDQQNPKHPSKIHQAKSSQNDNTIQAKKYRSFSSIFSYQMADQWFMCQCNFIIPALILLPSPEIFLIVIMVFAVIGVVVAFKKTKQRVNSVMLSLYPACFHACFLVFYWSNSVKVTIITEIICLGVYLLGSVHHSLFLLYQIVCFICYLTKNLCHLGKVEPKNTKPKENHPKKVETQRQEHVSPMTPQSSSVKEKFPQDEKKVVVGKKKVKKTLASNPAQSLKIKFTKKESQL